MPDDAGVRGALLEVDRQTRGLRYAVVWLTLLNGAALPPTASGALAPATEPPLTVDQHEYAFTPRLVAVRAGQPVNFTNSDPANHNVRTSSPITQNVFNVFKMNDQAPPS